MTNDGSLREITNYDLWNGFADVEFFNHPSPLIATQARNDRRGYEDFMIEFKLNYFLTTPSRVTPLQH